MFIEDCKIKCMLICSVNNQAMSGVATFAGPNIVLVYTKPDSYCSCYNNECCCKWIEVTTIVLNALINVISGGVTFLHVFCNNY